MVFLPYSVDVGGRMLPDNRVQSGTRESAGRTEIKAVRSMEMRGIISTSSSDAISSSSGGVIEFRKETGSAMIETVTQSWHLALALAWPCDVTRWCLFGQSCLGWFHASDVQICLVDQLSTLLLSFSVHYAGHTHKASLFLWA
jgi:hypothetical protein